MSRLDWAGLAASLAVLAATAVAAVAAWRSARATREAAQASRTAAEATRRSAAAAGAAAEASREAATAAERQAAAMERAEMAETMPYRWVRGTLQARHRRLAVEIGNSGRGLALNPVMRMFRGQLPGPELYVTAALPGGTTLAQQESLADPMPDATDGRWMVEVRYQDGLAREYAVQVTNEGVTNYYLVERREGETAGRYRPLIVAPPRQ